MKLTRENIWNECERLRVANKISANKLTTIIFPDYPNTLYATRRNLKTDGGATVPFKVLQFFGLKNLLLTNNRSIVSVAFENVSVESIITQLVNATFVFNDGFILTRLPQSIRNHKKRPDRIISLTTFEKAFELIGNIDMQFEYETVENLEEMF